MPYLRYLTHPQVAIDPTMPVPDWGLSEQGRQRAERFGSLPLLRDTRLIVSSTERKAVETAVIVATATGVPYRLVDDTHENDRSATGFLPPDEFEQVADAFFAAPHQSVRGWERAVDAQARIVCAVERLPADDLGGDLLIVGHGGVGTLLYCHLARIAIGREHDQAAGGGCLFTYDVENDRVVHAWRTIETLMAEAAISGGARPPVGLQ